MPIYRRTATLVMTLSILVIGCGKTEPSATPIPPTEMTFPPTATLVPSTPTTSPPTATSVPSTTTTSPPTATLVPPTATPVTPKASPATESNIVLQPDGSGTVTDIDGNTYSLVRIGDQWWMAENLYVTRDPDGNPITGYCYRNDPSHCDAYGRLYTWHVAMNGSTEERAQGICPKGWHVPDDAEWTVLFDYLGGEGVAGGKMKEAGTIHWNPPNMDATNSSGFNGLPAGGYYNRAYEGLGIGVHFWSSTESGSKAGLPTLHTDYASIIRLNEPKSVAASVRCIKD